MKDLHAAKKSHLTVAIAKSIEVHMEKKDMKGLKVKKGQKVHAHVPMVVTSTDPGHSRFKLILHMGHKNLYKDVKDFKESPRSKLARMARTISKGAH